MSTDEEVKPTDMAPPRPTPRSMIVKVETDRVHAHISTKDGTVKLVVPAAMVLKRMRPRESIVFFRATSKPGADAIELGERMEDESKRW